MKKTINLNKNKQIILSKSTSGKSPINLNKNKPIILHKKTPFNLNKNKPAILKRPLKSDCGLPKKNF